jgi:hypothetical protein
MSDSRLARLRKYIADYEHWCMVRAFMKAQTESARIPYLQKVSKKYNKDFDFFKQHATSHVAEDIEERGCTYNFSTWPGEGFQQEAAQAYRTTNRKNTEHQVSFSHEFDVDIACSQN